MKISTLLMLLNCLMYRLHAIQVVRYYDGDVVENYSASCNVIGGYCVPDNFTNLCESSVQSDTCPYCKCSENRKINSSSLKCSDTSCDTEVGFHFFEIPRKKNKDFTQMILTDKVFNCTGKVYGWKWRQDDIANSTVFKLQVWRRMTSQFHLIGSTLIHPTEPVISSQGYEDRITYLSETYEILIQPGDFLGIDSMDRFSKIAVLANEVTSEDLDSSKAYAYKRPKGSVLDISKSKRYFDYAAANFAALFTEGTYSNGSVECIILSSVATMSSSVNNLLSSGSLLQTNIVPSRSDTTNTLQTSTITSITTSYNVFLSSEIVSLPTIDLVSLQTSITLSLSTLNTSTFQLVSSSPHTSESQALSPSPHTSISRLLSPSSSINRQQSFNITTMTIVGAHFILTILILLVLSIVIIYIFQKKRKRRQEVEGVVNSTTTGEYAIEVLHDNTDTPSNKRQETTRFYHELEPSSITQTTDDFIIVPTMTQRQPLSHQYTNITTHTNGKLKFAFDSNRFFVNESIFWQPAQNEEQLYCQLAEKRYREISLQTIIVTGVLGSGNFGVVYKGSWSTSEGRVAVAMKTLKGEAGYDEKIKFLQEAAIMGQFSHPNIIKLHGIITVGKPLTMVLELMENGDLKEYLESLREGSFTTEIQPLFMKFSIDIASGMKYLADKSFIHRDLAARNVLLDNTLTCKIGDFGMARDLLGKDNYISSNHLIPVRWTAVEALLTYQFSVASDVWSYGVVLYEIWSTGREPFEELTNVEVIDHVRSGHRLTIPPDSCPDTIKKIMTQCWLTNPSRRPSFTDILNLLEHTGSTTLYSSSVEDENNHRYAILSSSPPHYLCIQNPLEDQTTPTHNSIS